VPVENTEIFNAGLLLIYVSS